MARRQPQEPPPINYPTGDNARGVVFYRISEARLPWESTKEVIRAIATEFIQQGPFLVRFGYRPPDGKGEYWIGFNAEACGRAFERDIDIRAYRITRTLRLPGRDPNPPLKRVLTEEAVRRLSAEPEPDQEWGDHEAAAQPSVDYVDHYFGVAFYRLVASEIDPQFTLEAVRDVATMLLQRVGRARPIVLRVRIMPEPPHHYWVALNTTVGATLFERMLAAEAVQVKKQIRPPDGFGNPTLRSVFQLDGVPVQPPGSVPAEAPAPRARQVLDPEPMAEEEQPQQAQRDRWAWARGLDMRGRMERLRQRNQERGRERGRRQPPAE